MSKEIITEEIDILMETIAEQWEIIRAYEGKIPFIELDIFLSNIRKLYDDLRLLEKINKSPGFDPEKIKSKFTREPSFVFETGSKPKPSAEPEPQPEPVSPAEPEPEPTSLSEPEPEPAAIQPEQPKPVTEPEPATEEHAASEPEIEAKHSSVSTEEQEPEIEANRASVNTEEQESKPESTEQKNPADQAESEQVQPSFGSNNNNSFEEAKVQPAEPPAQKKPMPAPDLFGSHAPTLADRFQVEKKSVNDHLTTEADDNSLGNRMQKSQITDLKSAIGINDKFLFINELFKGDLAGYNRAVEELNSCQTKQEAVEKINEMRNQFNWPEHSSSFLRLNDFMKRRYSV
jgi:hypothetical protein